VVTMMALGRGAEEEILRLEELIPELDYLSISAAECRALRGHACKEAAKKLGRMVRGWAVVHRPGGSWSSDGRRLFETKVEEASGVIVGAGDAFAAALIHFGLRGFAIEAMVARAHEWATNSLVLQA
ncbi:MAG: PfkB family carbohydrate kinase, partial [Planctomycetota bacterium]